MDENLNPQGTEDEVEGHEAIEENAEPVKAPEEEAEAAPVKEKGKSPKRFTDEEIKAIREMRAIPRDDNPARPKHGHAEIAEKFGRSGQQISSIVRNLSHVDPEYTPVFDGFMNRPRDADGKVIKAVKPAPEIDPETGEPVKKKRGRKKATEQAEAPAENAEA